MFRQIFVNRWSSSIFAKITLALLFLLKQWALQASNHRQLSKVLFNEPGKVRLFVALLLKIFSIVANCIQI